ncbi:MAG: TadE/TadG family type IV pilus assembly protein [Litorimonas sp.]
MRLGLHIFDRFRRQTSGAVALEFAMLSVPFLAMIFGIMEVAFKTMVQTELDNKLYYIASDISKVAFDQDDSAQFMMDALCDQTGTFFTTCSDIEIGVQVVSTDSRLVQYRETSAIGTWELGCAYDTLLVELNYPVSNFLHPIVVADVVERDGEKYYRSRGVIRREPLLSNGSTC